MVRGALESQALANGLLSRDEVSPLDLYRFCQKTAPVLPEALLLSLSKPHARGKARRQTASLVWEFFMNVYRAHKENPLITGRDVMEAVSGVSGPTVGKLLSEVEEARALGLVKTKNEALDFLHRLTA
jgi:hypothetical protein